MRVGALSPPEKPLGQVLKQTREANSDLQIVENLGSEPPAPASAALQQCPLAKLALAPSSPRGHQPCDALGCQVTHYSPSRAPPCSRRRKAGSYIPGRNRHLPGQREQLEDSQETNFPDKAAGEQGAAGGGAGLARTAPRQRP